MIQFKDGELELMREVELLPVVLTVFERDKVSIESSDIKTKWPYIESINDAMNRVTRELGRLKGEMRSKGLKIAKEDKTTDGIECIFLCRGYSQKFVFSWEVVKSETEKRMHQYLTGKIGHS